MDVESSEFTNSHVRKEEVSPKPAAFIREAQLPYEGDLEETYRVKTSIF